MLILKTVDLVERVLEFVSDFESETPKTVALAGVKGHLTLLLQRPSAPKCRRFDRLWQDFRFHQQMAIQNLPF